MSIVYVYTFCSALVLQFEQGMYMVNESDGMVAIRVIASQRSSFEYTLTVTSIDLTASGKFDSVL